MEDLTGRQLGPYRVVAPLGEGGMASVYKGFQPSVERFVALKILPRHFASDPEFVARFKQESRVIAKLQHVHILPVHDYGEDQGYTYIVMPFLEAGTLANEIAKGAMDLGRVLEVTRQLGSALDYAHSRGIVHRDVKPANVLIDPTGNCLLTDFGIAKIVSQTVSLTQTGGIVGTPAYMSPEQIGAGELDGRSDLYSLGVVIFEMVTGRVPFQAETPAAALVKHLHDPLPMPSSLRPDLPEGVEKVIMKALSKSRHDRYQTAEELIESLDRALAPGVARSKREDTAAASLPHAKPETMVPESPTRRSVRLRTVLLFAIPSAGLIMLIAGAMVLGPQLLTAANRAVAQPSPTVAERLAIRASPTATAEPSRDATKTSVPATATPTEVEVQPALFSQLGTTERLYPSQNQGGALSPDGSQIALGLLTAGNLELSLAGVTPTPLPSNGLLIYRTADLIAADTIEMGVAVRGVAWTEEGIWASLEGGELFRVSPDGSIDERVAIIGNDHVGGLAVSPAGRYLAAWSFQSTDVLVIDTETGQTVTRLRDHPDGIGAVAFSPDGSRIASSGGSSLLIWDAQSGQLETSLQGHEHFIFGIGWSPDGSRLVTASEDGTLGIWSADTGELLFRPYPAAGNLRSVAVSPDGRYVAAGSSTGAVPIWDLENGQLVSTLEDDWVVQSLIWAPDGRLFSITTASSAVRGGRVTAWGQIQ